MRRECESWADRLFEPEESLSEEESKRLACHLAKCEECACERELFLDSLSDFEDVNADLEPCPFLRAKVWEKIREEECCPKSLLRVFLDEDKRWKPGVLKLAAAAAAIVLGFGLGRSLRSNPHEVAASSPSTMAEALHEDQFLSPDMIELASQEGFSLEIFPESTQFSPIDRDMMTALATSQESKKWLQVDRGVVIPLRYISQGVPAPVRKAR